MLYKVHCLKCREEYEDVLEENYYCPSCLAERKKIADKIDKKRLLRPPAPVKSELEIYDESPKVHGFVRVKL